MKMDKVEARVALRFPSPWGSDNFHGTFSETRRPWARSATDV